MAQDDKFNKNKHLSTQEDDTETGTGQGGASGAVEFRDFLSSERSRDDDLPYDEFRRLLTVHNETHERVRVKKQKETRERYKELKEGKVSLQAHRQEKFGAGMGNQFKSHPTLKDKAQFSGTDNKVNPSPNEYIAETNEDKKEQKLQYQLQLQNQNRHENTPKFNPKPLPR